MFYWKQFSNFDPKNGIVPSYPFHILPSIANRARPLIATRTIEMIEYGAHTIDWLIEDLHKELKKQDPNYPFRDSISDCWSLKQCINGYIIGQDPEFPSAKDYEYFAILALWKISDVIQYSNKAAQLKESKSVHSSLNETVCLTFAGNFALEALEAITHAEKIILENQKNQEIWTMRYKLEEIKEASETNLEETAKKLISTKARRAAIARHAENHSMKAEALEWYEKNMSMFKSKDAAAEQIAGKIVPAKFRTVRTWIGQYHKKIQSASKL
ncbi:hypothetical protein JQK19_04740 [Chromobacterium violaceum]|uniref:hypothetical protein n=1 Tax=Chromobacterium violaceum TaxID=536 RepID=UPI001BE7E35A|nr:hypothetical protein [Chromobacterium violaceum]MBT2866542.1 hypothetical protein [Chromobacterium violaceum]